MSRYGLATRSIAVLLLMVVLGAPASAHPGRSVAQPSASSGLVFALEDGQDDDLEPAETPEPEEIEPTEEPEDDSGSQDGSSDGDSSNSGSSDDDSGGSDDSGSGNSSDDSGDDGSPDDDGGDDDSSNGSGNDDGSGESDDSSVDGEVVPIIDNDGDATTDGFRAGQAVVRLQPGASIEAFNARHGTTLVAEIETHDLYLLALPGDHGIEDVERQLSSDPDTRWSELNYVNQAPEGRPGYFFVSGAPGSDAGSSYAPELLGYLDAQSCGTGEGITVAVLDSGVDASHSALEGHILENGWNALNDSGDVRDIGNDLDDDADGMVDEMVGHGTHVAGIIAQVAPGAKILPIKVLSSDGVGDAFYVAAGIYYAIEQGANVINLSLSSTYDARVVAEAVAEANEAGVIVVAAAGNNSTDRVLEFPAADVGVLGIAATDENDRKSEFSNYGERIDLSAPGVDIVSALPGGLYAAWSGTSMAAPFVAGAAALVAGAHPDWNALQISEQLLQRSVDIDDLNPDYAEGLGAGRLDVLVAMDCTSE